MGDNRQYIHMQKVCGFLRDYFVRVEFDRATKGEELLQILDIDPLYLVKETHYFKGLQYIPDDYGDYSTDLKNTIGSPLDGYINNLQAKEPVLNKLQALVCKDDDKSTVALLHYNVLNNNSQMTEANLLTLLSKDCLYLAKEKRYWEFLEYEAQGIEKSSYLIIRGYVKAIESCLKPWDYTFHLENLDRLGVLCETRKDTFKKLKAEISSAVEKYSEEYPSNAFSLPDKKLDLEQCRQLYEIKEELLEIIKGKLGDLRAKADQEYNYAHSQAMDIW